MKTFLLGTLFAFSTMMLCGCTESFEDFIVNDKAEEAWDGIGTPSWLSKKVMDISLEKGWDYDNYYFSSLWKVYLFNYEERVLVYMHYDNLRLNFFEEGGYCYTLDGKQVDFGKVNDKFDKTKELIYTNQLGGEGLVPQVEDMRIPDWEKYQWMQTELENICKKVDEADSFITNIHIALSNNKENEEHIAISYNYCPYAFEEIHMEKYYTPDGEPISNIPENNLINHLSNYTYLWQKQLHYTDIR